MKVAFDECIPAVMVRVFQTLATHGNSLSAEIVTAKNYKPTEERGDQNWVVRFGDDGGKVVISGDTRLRSRVHERAALSEAGLLTYCFESQWGSRGFFTKSAMLLHWWPKIRKHMDTAKAGTCWEIPFSWTYKDFKDVSTNPQKITAKKPPKLKVHTSGEAA